MIERSGSFRCCFCCCCHVIYWSLFKLCISQDDKRNDVGVTSPCSCTIERDCFLSHYSYNEQRTPAWLYETPIFLSQQVNGFCIALEMGIRACRELTLSVPNKTSWIDDRGNGKNKVEQTFLSLKFASKSDVSKKLFFVLSMMWTCLKTWFDLSHLSWHNHLPCSPCGFHPANRQQ